MDATEPEACLPAFESDLPEHSKKTRSEVKLKPTGTIALMLLFTGCLLAPAISQAQSGPVIWAVSSLQRVGQTNPAGTTSAVQIKAGRGEYESYQIIVKAPGGGLSNVNVTVSDLTGP